MEEATAREVAANSERQGMKQWLYVLTFLAIVMGAFFSGMNFQCYLDGTGPFKSCAQDESPDRTRWNDSDRAWSKWMDSRSHFHQAVRDE
jgi:hypothetical protein